MPALAGAIFYSRENKRFQWIACVIWLLACRDGLSLLVIGLGIYELIKKNFSWGLVATALGLGWILLLSEWLYPMLNNQTRGPAALSRFSHLGDSISSI